MFTLQPKRVKKFGKSRKEVYSSYSVTGCEGNNERLHSGSRSLGLSGGGIMLIIVSLTVLVAVVATLLKRPVSLQRITSLPVIL
jgi:hypothetical protein